MFTRFANPVRAKRKQMVFRAKHCQDVSNYFGMVNGCTGRTREMCLKRIEVICYDNTRQFLSCCFDCKSRQLNATECFEEKWNNRCCAA